MIVIGNGVLCPELSSLWHKATCFSSSEEHERRPVTILYARSPEYGEEQIRDQLLHLYDYSIAQRWQVHFCFFDDGYAWGGPGRPSFHAMTSMISAGACDIVLARGQSRISRTIIYFRAFERFVAAKRARLHFLASTELPA
jgi:DNA invertase Pin-like site-specific DNA recombinase